MLAEPETKEEPKPKKGPMKMRDISIRCLDDGNFVVSVGMGDGNGNHEHKEYAYEDKDEMLDALDDFLGESPEKEGLQQNEDY